ncbi:ADP-dependent glucokinase/phosphofructokinase [Microbacterium sp. NPDC089180]|uniref:ADP-dependent glucokinase/phosphofructokinase n=1 Tax=unclassified Microbacterium TaxID=2609290 RepID=UPI00344AF684
MSKTLSGDDLREVDEARAKYAAVLEGLDGLVRTAPLIATGFSVCNDHICSIGEAEFAAIVDAQDDDDLQVRELARWLHDRILQGRGGEVLAARGGFDWIVRTFRGTPTMGGTGAQVSRVLASVGVQSVLALSDRTAAQLDTMDDGLLVVGDDGRLHSPREITPSPVRPNDPIFVFQFTQGVPLRGADADADAEAIVTRRSTRIILRAPARPLDLDDAFAAYVEDHRLTTVLLSGFQTAEPAAVEPTRAWFLQRFAWLADRPRLVHFEIAEYESHEHARSAVAGLTGFANSLGMSLSELGQLSSVSDPVEAAIAIANELGLDRVSVHADDFAFVVTTGDPALEEEALLAGCLLAASRAVTGAPVLPREMPAGTTLSPLPASLRRESPDPRYRLVAVPSPYTPSPRVTLGLGDTFVAGMLLALAPR